MAKNESKPVKGLTYEEAFAELETIMAALESGEKPLDESMQLFERGQVLIKLCTDLLDNARLKVQALSGEVPADIEENE
jgi:exodeoxyribonuclease VII small subunit